MYTCTRALFAESVFIYCDFYLLSVCVYIVWFLFMFQQTRSSANCVKNIQSKCHFLLAHLDIGWHKNAKNIGSCIARTRSIFTFTAATIMMMAFSILLRLSLCFRPRFFRIFVVEYTHRHQMNVIFL